MSTDMPIINIPKGLKMADEHILLEMIDFRFKGKKPLLTELLDNPNCKLSECADVLKIFGGHEWSSISLSSVQYKDEVIGRMSRQAFFYYLPAFLKIIITDYLSADAFSVVFIKMLTPPTSHGVPRQSWVDGWYSDLNDDQKVIIASVLKFVANKHASLVADRALEKFWQSHLTGC